MYEKTLVVRVADNPFNHYITSTNAMVFNPYYKRALHDLNSKNETIVKIVIEWEHQQHV